MVFWKQMNKFWCQLAQVVHRQGHETFTVGVRRSHESG